MRHADEPKLAEDGFVVAPLAVFAHCAAVGAKAKVENAAAGDGRAATTVTCEFPGGRKVVANSILELEGGRIVRELDVQLGDPK